MVACAKTMARLAEDREHRDLQVEALAVLLEVLDTLRLSDDEAATLAVKDLTALVNDEQRFADLRAIGIGEQLLAAMRDEARDLLAELLDDGDDEPHLIAVPDMEGDNENEWRH
jgi:regulator of RNase E activity RraB